ncbi:hypothetical protein EYF80_017794 [Liparis tanakae]|uniref:Uncharacterized protein n=1 Tax=Liparis tanakae TaxID=230148 RepID=A0A4Z2I1R0_9TELE|nr:hypothetical protein EYF80_017794 [Liparis tanakae]
MAAATRYSTSVRSVAELKASSKPSSLRKATLASEPAEPTTLQPLILAIWPTMEPTAPAAEFTSRVSPSWSPKTSSIPYRAVCLERRRWENQNDRNRKKPDYVLPPVLEEPLCPS